MGVKARALSRGLRPTPPPREIRKLQGVTPPPRRFWRPYSAPPLAKMMMMLIDASSLVVIPFFVVYGGGHDLIADIADLPGV